MNQQALEKYLWGAATWLRGHIDAGDYKQFIFPLLFFKRICDVYDEEYAAALAESEGDREYARNPEFHRFLVPKEHHWNRVRETTTHVGLAIQQAMAAIEAANPETLAGIFGDASWTNKDRLSDETLVNLLEHFSAHTLSIAKVPDDQLGNAYEYLIKQFADDSGHTAVAGIVDEMTEYVLDAEVIDEIAASGDPKQVKRLQKALAKRLRKHEDKPKFKDLSDRLEKLRERAEAGLINSIEFIKELCKIARETVEAEKEELSEQEQKSAKAALTEMFLELKTDQTPAVVERIVNDIDEIVKFVRFDGWQDSSKGQREVQQALRRTLLKYKLQSDHELFERAYGYIKVYY